MNRSRLIGGFGTARLDNFGPAPHPEAPRRIGEDRAVMAGYEAAECHATAPRPTGAPARRRGGVSKVRRVRSCGNPCWDTPRLEHGFQLGKRSDNRRVVPKVAGIQHALDLLV